MSDSTTNAQGDVTTPLTLADGRKITIYRADEEFMTTIEQRTSGLAGKGGGK